MPKKLTKEEFIERARKIHGNKYDYSKVEYINISTDVYIICPTHGEFKQTPANHLRGKGCSKCVGKNVSNEDRIKIAKEHHNNKYVYDKTDFSKVKQETIVICPIHGAFKTDYDHHVNNDCGCPDCSKTKKLTKEEYIERAKLVHGDKYIYDDITYMGMHHFIYPICKEHGVFKIGAQSHLIGRGCPKCKSTSLEEKVLNVLNEHKIDFIYQANKKLFNWLDGLSLDFYIPSKNIAIECQGKQHFGEGGWVNDEEKRNIFFKEQNERDERKFKLCKDNNIKLIYYSNVLPKFEYFDKVYTDLEEIIRIIKK